MACDTITDILTRESGRIGPDIYGRTFTRSPWISLVKRDAFPEGMGETISNLTYERSAPTSAEPTWSNVSVVDGAEGGACLPSSTKIAIASTTRSYNLKRRVLEGPDFCVEELRTPFAVRSQLEKITDVLAEYSMIEWEIRYRHDYFTNVNRKVVVQSQSIQETNTMATTYPAYQPGSTLTQGVLDRYRLKLLRDGANMSALGKDNGMAVLALVCSPETSERIIKDNADIRNDLRYADPPELLKAMGVSRSYKGFYHILDPYPRRFTYSGGTFTEIAVFDTTAATKGNKARVNPLWEVAPYEESFIFDPTVFVSRIPKPITNPAPNFKFDPVNYLGDWKLKNILDRVCNPDGTIVYHRGILAHAAEPLHPERGVAFVHLRCDPALNLVTSCS
jgi:hypothetical protein